MNYRVCSGGSEVMGFLVSVAELYTRPAYIIPVYRDFSALRQVW